MKCQSFLQTVCFLCCLGAFFSRPLLVEAKSGFEHPNSFIGNAGWSGGLELWLDVGEVAVGGSSNLPLRLRFATDVTRENSLFGGNWWCPLLESVGNKSADDFEWTTLGGGRKFLLKSGESGFHSKDRGTSAHEADGVWQFRSEGWAYRYRDGKIAEAITPEGARLNWEYQDGFPAGINREGAEILSVSRTPGRGGCLKTAKTGGTGVPPVWRPGLAAKTSAHTGGMPMPPERTSTLATIEMRTSVSVKIHGSFGDFEFREESGDVVKKVADEISRWERKGDRNRGRSRWGFSNDDCFPVCGERKRDACAT
jgi:hypothetical protein